MSLINIWIHCVWSTKNREPFLTKEIRYKAFKHIRTYAEENNIRIDFLNGYSDHVHCLISLKSQQNIAKVINLIKGESSYWINKQELTQEKFEWQNDYYAASVCKSNINQVRDYIKNQEEHHRNNSFNEEMKRMI